MNYECDQQALSTHYDGQHKLNMKNAVFWDVTACGSCKNRRFGGKYHLHHQGDKNFQARNVSSNQQQKHAAKKLHSISSQRASVAGYC
jgi:hypothetical protein